MTGTAGLRRPTGALAAVLLSAALLLALPAGAPQAQPASPQPSLPKPLEGMPLGSPIIGGGQGTGQGASQGTGDRASRTPSGGRRAERGRPRTARHAGHRPRHRFAEAEPLERPALAGVELVAPLPVPVQPPHFTVPVPAYLPETIAAFYTTPLPPVVCHRVRRDPTAPDPHLIRETTVLCEADNP